MDIPTTWQRWLEQWDRQQERHRPHREEGLQVMVSLVESLVPDGRGRVLDLACGCGSISTRILARLPRLDIVAVDRDPVLLRIARGLFADNPQVCVVDADLYRVDWASALGNSRFDAIVTATSFHWLPERDVQRIYRDLLPMLRPGGIFANLDWMPIANAPGLGAIADRYVQSHEASVARMTPSIPSWGDWWEAVAQEPALAQELATRRRFPEWPAEFMPAGTWHEQELLAAGFREAAILWRCFSSAVVAAAR